MTTRKATHINQLLCAVKTGAIAATIASVTINAQAMESSSGFTVSPMVGKIRPDEERGLESYGEFGFLGLGYEWNNKWGLELNYTQAKVGVENVLLDVDLGLTKIDGLYYIGQQNLQPYIVLGFGLGKYDADFLTDASNDDFADFGIGLRYLLNDVVALRSDVRMVHDLDASLTDYTAGIGVMFKFGSGKAYKAPVPVATPTPTPSPAGPADTDGDGVYDASDRCPNSAPGSQVNTVGCPLDSDGDGVADVNDNCPDSEAGAKVDAVGCYEVFKEDVSVNLRVLFASNSATVNSVNYDEIKEVADFLTQFPATTVVIEGHTDSQGAAQYNKDLSQRRAEAVAKILLERHDVDENRVRAVGYGEERPIVGNDTAENRAKNRRVQAVVSAVVEKVIK